MILALFSYFFLAVFAHAESGPGNGTDYVKVLFAEAQFEINKNLLPIASPDSLAVSAEVKAWLGNSVDGESRLDRLKFYLRKMDLQFQEASCSDGSGKPATICFFPGPTVLISLAGNRMTTASQAAAMLVHEAGHFTGEMNHLFLDRAGVEIAEAAKMPGYFSADFSRTEIVANVFSEKDACDAGTSALAIQLKKAAAAELARQCAEKNYACAIEKADFLFQGEAEYKEGRGYTMRVTCAVKGILKLR